MNGYHVHPSAAHGVFARPQPPPDPPPTPTPIPDRQPITHISIPTQ